MGIVSRLRGAEWWVWKQRRCGRDAEGRIARPLFHELLHVGIEVGDDGGERYYVRPHDLEDFRACVDRWVAGWIAT